ncbi:MAG: hypothetical protein KC620_25500, partial [Myxococcales bacterium]|nr:hypothetical protein [Myxococcales bacterium]
MPRTASITALTLAATLICVASAAHAATTKTVGDLSITANWSYVAFNRYEASGTVSIGPVQLSGADIAIDRRPGHRTITATGDLDLNLFPDCTLDAPSVSLGYAIGADIKQNVGADAPVQDDESYLYVAADNGTTLNCLGFGVELGGGQGGALYINPNDPSVFVRATGLTDAIATPATQRMMRAARLQIDDAWFGVSAHGWLPWSADYPINGQVPRINAHMLIGGSFEVTTTLGPVAVEDGSVALRKGIGGLMWLGVSGAIAMPVAETWFGDIEVPLVEGAMELAPGDALNFELTAGGSALDGLAVPDLVRTLLESGASSQQTTLSGQIGLANNDDWHFGVATAGDLGPFAVSDARISVSPAAFEVSGDV